MSHPLSLDGSEKRTFTIPPEHGEQLQVRANLLFNGNFSRAVRHALAVTYGIGEPELPQTVDPSAPLEALLRLRGVG